MQNNTSGSNNTAIGQSTLRGNLTGNDNAGIGYKALATNTKGSRNTGIGSMTLASSEDVSDLTAIGYSALAANTTGTSNTATGSGALLVNTTGSKDTAIGQDTLSQNTSGSYNTAVGANALGNNITGSNNTAIGTDAGPSVNDIDNTIAIGSGAFVLASNTVQLGNSEIINVKTSGSLTLGSITYPNTDGTIGQVLTTDGSGNLSWTTVSDSGSYVPYTGANGAVNLGAYDLTVNSITVGLGSGDIGTNTVVGNQAFASNTTGLQNSAFGSFALTANINGTFNSAFGNEALTSNTGSGNSSFGNEALAANTIGLFNCAFGNVALAYNTTGQFNSAFGSNSLTNNTTGSNNVAVGTSSAENIITGSNNVAIGYSAGPSNDLTNTVCLGYDATVTTSNTIKLGNTNISSLQCQVALTVVSDVREKTNFEDLDAGLNFIENLKPLRFDWKLQEGQTEVRKDIGFTAQDLLEVQDTTGINIPNLVNTNDPEKYGVCYTQLIPILVKAIQDLKKEVDELKNVKNQ